MNWNKKQQSQSSEPPQAELWTELSEADQENAQGGWPPIWPIGGGSGGGGGGMSAVISSSASNVAISAVASTPAGN